MLQVLVKLPQMPAVHKTVVHFQAHAQRLTAICRNSSARGQTARSIFCMRGHSISYSFMVSGLRYSCFS